MNKPLLVIGALLFGALANANPPASERKIQASHVVSERDPAIRIELPESAHYVGAVRWHLFGVADCELHMFVEADPGKKVTRYYWIQFEALLPGDPTKIYSYKNGHDTTIAGLSFNLRARFGESAEKPKPGSDLEHAFKLIMDAGYKLPRDLMNVRFVHLPDDAKRKELMVIYAEDLAPTGFSTADLIAGGTIRPEWAAIETELIARAKARIRFLPQK
jgi:hypothetical protein